MANDLLNRAARCDDFNSCVDIMLAATAPRSPETIGVAVARIGEMPKPQKGNRKVARELNFKGLEAFRKGDLSSASSLLGRGALEDPSDVEIQSNLGLVLVRERRLPEAKVALTNAITLNSRRTGAWIPMAELFFESGETEKSKGALLLAWEFSENREKTVAYFEKQAVDDGKMRVVYSSVLAVLTPSKPIAAASPLEGQPKGDSKMVYKRELVAMLKEQRESYGT
jgi:tetratricopeptide (TPR) repeat protein